MSMAIHPELESKIRARAESEGLSVEEYLEKLLRADQAGADELEALAMEGMESGAAIEPGASYWQEKHRRLDERLKRSDLR
jgi:hypothetical protein